MPIYEPKISAVAITPNPVSINTKFVMSVSVTEVEVVMYRVSPICGTFKSGQAVKLSVRTEVQ